VTWNTENVTTIALEFGKRKRCEENDSKNHAR